MVRISLSGASMKILIFATIVVCNALLARVSEARPEYATREKLSCIQCHETPWGGGPRTVLGKIYGSHLHQPGKYSNQDAFYFDLRTLGYYPTNVPLQNSTQGLGQMEAAATGNLAAIEGGKKGDDTGELRAVGTYNVSSMSGGAQLREGYARYGMNLDDPDHDWTLVVGHFYVPFGLLSDEHRQYTLLQTNMTLNNYDTGIAFSQDLPRQFHIDLAVVNDFQTGGSLNSGDFSAGLVFNARWNPSSLPFLLGVSANYQHLDFTPQPYATSVYGVLSVDRLTQNRVSASLSLERVDGKNWNNPTVNNGGINPALGVFFIPSSDPSYQSAILRSHSVGYSALAKYWLTQQFYFFYKLDYLALDISAQSDAYWRHGWGFEDFLSSNLSLNLRGEKAFVGRKEVQGSNVLASQDDVFAVLRLWL